MVGYKDTLDVAKKLLKLYRKESNDWLIVSFIHNGSELTTPMRHSFKIEKHKIQSNIFKITT